MTRLIGYIEAAALVGVSVAAVKQWKSRHRLNPAGRDGRRLLFAVDDVLAADQHARQVPQGRKRKGAA